jgi:hypothetical protein
MGGSGFYFFWEGVQTKEIFQIVILVVEMVRGLV